MGMRKMKPPSDVDPIPHRSAMNQSPHNGIFESLPDCLIILNSKGEIIDANPAAERTFGCARQELIQLPFRDIVHSEHWDTLNRFLAQSFNQGNSQCELVCLRKDNSIFDLEIRSSILQINEIENLLIIARDITEHKRAQKALIESEAKNSALVEQAKDGVVILQDLKVKFANAALAMITGYTGEELLNMNLVDLIAPESRELVWQRYQARMAGEDVPSVYEAKVLHKDGIIKDIEISAGIINYNGKPADMGIIRDITDRKQGEKNRETIHRINKLLLGELDVERAIQGLCQELKEMVPHDCLALSLIHKEQNQLDTFFTKAHDDRDGVNPEVRLEPLCEGYRGSLVEQILHERKNAIQSILPESGSPLEMSFHLRGVKSYLAIPLVNIGVPLGMLFLTSAIENAYNKRHAKLLEQIQSQLVLWIQHHKLIERLSDSEAKFRNLIDNSNDAIYILQGTRFIFVSKKFEELLEYKLEEVSQPDFDFMKLVAPESIPLIEERSRRIDAGERLPSNYEFQGLSKSGRVVDFDLSVSYITYNGEPAVQGILRDISERKRFEEKEREMQLELMQHSKLASIGMLAAGIAHNLNVPLQGLANQLELIKMTRSDIPYLESMLTQIQRMSAIINNMLFKSRQEQDQNAREIDLNQLLVEELTFLDADLSFKHNIEKDYHFDSELPAIQGIYSDFSQALLNIIKNALDAMFNTEKKRLSIKTEALENGGILVEISDTGYGISDENIGHIFDPFFTTKPPVGDSRSGEPNGTGLGLSTAYQLLKKYEAQFDVDSEPGQGTTFRIFLPVKEKRSSLEMPSTADSEEAVLEELT